ncbi:MAG: N,N-dimethylformamidase beta subunit family domain-containing protein [Pseudomonadota bacterium]
MPDQSNSSQAPQPGRLRRARHILDTWYIGPARDLSVLEIWGYTDRFSYCPGDRVALRVHTTGARWSLEVGRDGVQYEPLLKVEALPGQTQDTPFDCSIVGCGWPAGYEFVVPDDWRPGGYLITLRAQRGDECVEEHHLIVVRRARQAPRAPYVLVCATGTWVAYNCWGGSNAYEGIAGKDGRQFSPVLSTQRPWTRGFCRLPDGAPRTLPITPPTPGEMVRYPYMEWAYSYGYSKKYASAGWASYERPFARWCEAEGFELDFATQHDLAEDPGLLAGYACAIFVGHDEYWSREMRQAVDRFTETGGRVARFAGNFFWQIRLNPATAQQICYKYTATAEDPVRGTEDAHLLTGAWEQPEVGWPGAHTFGANATGGIYAGLGNCAGRGAGGFTVYRPDHWSLAGAHLGYGDNLGAEARIFGYEVDGMDVVMRDGLPFPTGADGASGDIQIVAMGLGVNEEADHGIWGETLYIGQADARWLAGALRGGQSDAAYDRAVRGNGVMVHWHRGRGEVFNAATCEWVAGLIRHDRQVEQVTRNVLSRFAHTD